jgi:hypothetical protein
MLVGCGGSQTPIGAPGAMPQMPTNRQSSLYAEAPATNPNLYVVNNSNNTVTEYAPGSSNVLRTISKGIDNPVALAFGP